MRKELTIASLRALLDGGALTPREAVMLCREVDESVIGRPMYDRALKRAAYAAERIATRSVRDMTGIPIAIDACIGVVGQGSGWVGAQEQPSYDSTIVHKLDGYGALILGQIPCVPLGPACSAGAREAVGRRMCLAALGVGVLPGQAMDNCLGDGKLTALKPSFGTVSRFGVNLPAPSLKQVGIVALGARDAATVMDAISDFDPYDPAMRRPNCYDYAQLIGREAKGMAVACAQGAGWDELAGLGLELSAFDMPDRICETYDVIQGCEMAFTLASHDPQALPEAWRTQVMGGREWLEDGRYERALSAREEIALALEGALEGRAALSLPLERGPQARPVAAMAAELSGLPCVSRGNRVLLGRWGQETTLLQLIDGLERREQA